jgi:hypothetical protein
MLRLLDQKGTKIDILKAFKVVKEATKKLEPLATALPSDVTKSEKEEQKLQITTVTEDLRKATEVAVAEIMKAYELIRNLFVGKAGTQWDKITLEMLSKDPWFGVDGESHSGPRRQIWSSFLDCIELHKLTIFAVNAAETQRYYMQQRSVKKPQRVPVRQYMARMGLLNDYLAYLPTVKNITMAVEDTKTGNVPFGEADLASIILKLLPPMWLNQYNLNHMTLPKSPRQLLPDLEAIERVMNEKHNKKVKAKAKAKDTAALINAKTNPKKRVSTGSNEQ